jgi:hypothetical protein
MLKINDILKQRLSEYKNHKKRYKFNTIHYYSDNAYSEYNNKNITAYIVYYKSTFYFLDIIDEIFFHNYQIK